MIESTHFDMNVQTIRTKIVIFRLKGISNNMDYLLVRANIRIVIKQLENKPSYIIHSVVSQTDQIVWERD